MVNAVPLSFASAGTDIDKVNSCVESFHHYQPICLKVGMCMIVTSNYFLENFRKFFQVVFRDITS